MDVRVDEGAERILLRRARRRQLFKSAALERPAMRATKKGVQLNTRFNYFPLKIRRLGSAPVLLLFLLGSFLRRFLFCWHLKILLEEFDSGRPFSNQLTQQLDERTGYIQDIEVVAFVLSTEFFNIFMCFAARTFAKKFLDITNSWNFLNCVTRFTDQLDDLLLNFSLKSET